MTKGTNKKTELKISIFKRIQNNGWLLLLTVLSVFIIPAVLIFLGVVLGNIIGIDAALIGGCFIVGLILGLPLTVIGIVLLFKGDGEKRSSRRTEESFWNWVKNIGFIVLCILAGTLISDPSVTRDSIPSRIYVIGFIILAIVIVLGIIYLIVKFIKRSRKH